MLLPAVRLESDSVHWAGSVPSRREEVKREVWNDAPVNDARRSNRARTRHL